MLKIVHIDSSSRSTTSTTRTLSKYFADALQKAAPRNELKYRDLVQEHVPYVTELGIGALYTPPDKRSAEQQKAIDDNEKGVNDFVNADIYVLGIPMYNFTVPAVFKAFIDLTVIPGKTFSYENGVPKPLLHNKKAFVLTASGGKYDAPPMSGMNFLEPYLRAIFGFIGITDITFITAPGHSEEEISTAIAAAKVQIDSAVQKVKLQHESNEVALSR